MSKLKVGDKVEHFGAVAVRRPEIGDKVTIRKTMLYTGRVGILKPASNDPEDFWDFYVDLKENIESPARTIGVTVDQVELCTF